MRFSCLRKLCEPFDDVLEAVVLGGCCEIRFFDKAGYFIRRFHVANTRSCECASSFLIVIDTANFIDRSISSLSSITLSGPTACGLRM